MKFKPNYFNQFLIFVSSLTIGVIPMTFIMILILKPEELKEYWRALLVVPLLIIAYLVVFNAINFIITLFVKTRVILHEDCFSYRNTIYKYSDVIEMEFDIGAISKTSFKPCILVLYRDGQAGIVINSPSIIMIIAMRKKLKHLPFRISGWKFICFSFIMMIVVSLVIGVIARISNG